MGKISRVFEVVASSDPILCHCNECNRETKHDVAVTYRERGNEDAGGGNSVDWWVDNELVKCLGCETVSFRRASGNSEDFDFNEDGTGEFFETVSYFPARASHASRFEPYALPYGLSAIYLETLSAVDNDQPLLAAIGIRAIIEAVCADKNVTGRNLKNRIDKLQSLSLVTAEGAALLHTLRGLGNNAAHQVKRHSSAELLLAMKVVDHLLEGTYIIPDESARIFKAVAATPKLSRPSISGAIGPLPVVADSQPAPVKAVSEVSVGATGSSAQGTAKLP